MSEVYVTNVLYSNAKTKNEMKVKQGQELGSGNTQRNEWRLHCTVGWRQVPEVLKRRCP